MHGHREVYEAGPLPGNTWIHVGNPEMYSHLLLVCTRKKQCQQAWILFGIQAPFSFIPVSSGLLEIY